MHSHERLARLFREGFRALDIASPLLSFDLDRDAAGVRGILETVGQAVAGVRTGGLVSGYVLRRELGQGNCAVSMRAFAEGQVLDVDAGLPEALRALEHHEYCFLATMGTVDAIVSRADVEKPPARMWLFGIISLMEMNLVRTIEQNYPGDSWKDRLSAGRLRKAEELRAERRRLGQDVSLLDCLQLPDKAQLLLRDAGSATEAGFASLRAAKQAVKDLVSLRNSLAHTQAIVAHDWAAVPLVAARLERVLARAAPP